jgi:hypothetical protein
LTLSLPAAPIQLPGGLGDYVDLGAIGVVAGDQSAAANNQAVIEDALRNNTYKPVLLPYAPPDNPIWVQGRIDLFNGTYLIGHGKKASVLKATAAHTAAVLKWDGDGSVLTDDPQDVYLAHFGVDGNGTNRASGGGQHLVDVMGLEDATTGGYNCIFDHLWLYDSVNVSFVFRLGGIDGLWVTFCELEDVRRDGINCGTSSRVNLLFNWIHGTPANGSKGDDLIIVRGREINVVGNIIEAPEQLLGRGIWVTNPIFGNQPMGDITVAYNYVECGAPLGSIVVEPITVSACDNIRINHNTCIAPDKNTVSPYLAGDGVRLVLDDDVTDLEIRGNRVESPGRHGIVVEFDPLTTFNCDRLRIEDNEIVFTGAAWEGAGGTNGRGITVIDVPPGSADEWLIRGNRVFNPAAEGIRLEGANFENMTVEDNHVYDAGKSGALAAGIFVKTIDGLRLIRNVCRDRGAGFMSYGLHIESITGDLAILENGFFGYATGAVNVVTQTGHTRIKVRDNDNWQPWQGPVVVDDGSWTLQDASSSAYVRDDAAITYGIQFPTGRTPRVHITPQDTGAHSALAHTIGVTTFIPRAIYVKSTAGAPSTTPTLFCSAEPQD